MDNFRTDALCAPIESADAPICQAITNIHSDQEGKKYDEVYYTFERNGQVYFVPEGDIHGNNRDVSFEMFMALLMTFGGSFKPMYALPKEEVEA